MPASRRSIVEKERKIGVSFPADLKIFYQWMNGPAMFRRNEDEAWYYFLRVNKISTVGEALLGSNSTKQERMDVFAFASYGEGDALGFLGNPTDHGKIVWCDHESWGYPDGTCEIIADSFTEFMQLSKHAKPGYWFRDSQDKKLISTMAS